MSNHRESLRATVADMYPILSDFDKECGIASGHYFSQDLWAARKIYSKRPNRHVDVGSRIDGFVAHLLVFMDVEVIDIRPLVSEVERLRFVQADATTLSEFENDSVESLSCLHAAEHFGLGRYSDPVDPEAVFRLMGSLRRVLSRGGRLYFSVPIGRERVEFNAHRVFSVESVLAEFHPLSLVSFGMISDDGKLHLEADAKSTGAQEYACGLFEFEKGTA
jgi:SAM-dependent methyltransferase